LITDEINTPDSSRYWYTDTYASLFDAGETQRKLDKEYVREWLANQGFRGEGDIPELTEEVRIEAARRYIEAYEQVTGTEFVVDDAPIAERVAGALSGVAG
jgi:phosphoribosylaminoimidazole-succinocarboxamide synthase